MLYSENKQKTERINDKNIFYKSYVHQLRKKHFTRYRLFLWITKLKNKLKIFFRKQDGSGSSEKFQLQPEPDEQIWSAHLGRRRDDVQM